MDKTSRAGGPARWVSAPTAQETAFLAAPGATGGLGPMTRREALRRGLLGAAALVAAGRLSPRALAAAPAAPPAPAAKPAPRAKAVIQIWMWGGPAHLDTFDPKPDAGTPCQAMI